MASPIDGLKASTSSRTLADVLDRQEQDRKSYGRFMEKPETIRQRTAQGRLQDSDKFLADALKGYPDKSALFMDIGAGLGNPDKNLQGITTRETAQTPGLAQKINPVAVDINDTKPLYKRNDLQTMFVPPTFDPVAKQGLTKYPTSGPLVMRAANSIDLLMNKQEAQAHLQQLAAQTKGREVYYEFNKDVLHKNPDSDEFFPMATLNSAGYDHNSHAWETDKNRVPYKLVDSGLKPSVSTSESFQLKDPPPPTGGSKPDPVGNPFLQPPSSWIRPGLRGTPKTSDVELPSALAGLKAAKPQPEDFNMPKLPAAPDMFSPSSGLAPRLMPTAAEQVPPTSQTQVDTSESFRLPEPKPSVSTSESFKIPEQAPPPNPEQPAIKSSYETPAQTFTKSTGMQWPGGKSDTIIQMLKDLDITAAPGSAEANLALQKRIR